MKIDVTDHVRREIECLFNDNHRKGKMMIMRMKTSGSQVDSPVAEGKRKESKSTKRGNLLVSADFLTTNPGRAHVVYFQKEVFS